MRQCDANAAAATVSFPPLSALLFQPPVHSAPPPPPLVALCREKKSRLFVDKTSARKSTITAERARITLTYFGKQRPFHELPFLGQEDRLPLKLAEL